MLKAYWKRISQSSKETERVVVSLSDLKLVKTAVGALLNASMGFGKEGFLSLPL